MTPDKVSMTPANTNAERLRQTAATFEGNALAYLMAASALRDLAKREWPQ